jgi:hypothetical protein
VLSRRRLIQSEAGELSISRTSTPPAPDTAVIPGSKGGSSGEAGLVQGLSGVHRQLSRAALSGSSSNSQRGLSAAGASSSKALGSKTTSSNGGISRSGSSSGLLGPSPSSFLRRPATAAAGLAAGAAAEGESDASLSTSTLPLQAAGAMVPSGAASTAAAALQGIPSSSNSSGGDGGPGLDVVLPSPTAYPDSSADSLLCLEAMQQPMCTLHGGMEAGVLGCQSRRVHWMWMLLRRTWRGGS